MNKNNNLDKISEILKVYDEKVSKINFSENNKNINNDLNIKDNEILNDKNEELNHNMSDTLTQSAPVIKNDTKVDNNLSDFGVNSSSSDFIKSNDNSDSNFDFGLKKVISNNSSYLNNNNNNNNMGFDDDKNRSNKFYFSYEKRLLLLIGGCLVSLVMFIFVFKISVNYKSHNKAFYSENSHSSYNICLRENNYYEEECLGENKQYVTRLIKDIPFVFTYNSFYEHKIDKEYKYHVDAHLKIFSQDNESHVLYEKNYSLLDETIFNDNNNVFTISDSVIIPFQEYNDLVEKYSNDYGILSNAEVTVEFFVNNKAVSTLNIPLNKQTISITKNDTENSLLVDDLLKKIIDKKSTLYNIILILIGLVLVVFFILLSKFLLKYGRKTDESTKYKNELNNLIKNYDRIIVEVRDISNLLDGKTIVKVENFLELVDVRDTLDKPILHVKINNIKDAFYVDDKDKVYEFVMKVK